LPLADALIIMAGLTAGLSVLVLVIAASVKRIGGPGVAGAARAVRELREEVDLLRGEIDRLRNDVEHTSRPPELDDIQNRLDFAERVLAQVKARDTLPGPR
jgi:hypothetical protein